jgi:GNAT superfamily N-acetyltransferase
MGDNGCSVLAYAITAKWGNRFVELRLILKAFVVYNILITMSKLNLQIATELDLPWILKQIDRCRGLMVHHQSGQWQGREPSLETLRHDILEKRYFLAYVGDERIGGTAILNHDLAYNQLLSGQWLNNQPYWVLHRFFINPDVHNQGFGMALLIAIEEKAKLDQIYNIRLDTHERNLPMTKLLIKAGYAWCGQVDLPHAGLRMVYHKVIGV